MRTTAEISAGAAAILWPHSAEDRIAMLVQVAESIEPDDRPGFEQRLVNALMQMLAAAERLDEQAGTA
jgi:hypothetical protein